MSKIKAKVLSDLHLDVLEQNGIMYDLKKAISVDLKSSKGEILCLCGDIGNPFKSSYVQFLNRVSSEFRDVLVVAGNHEFYYSEYYSTKKKISDICDQFKNCHFLDISTKCVLEFEKLQIRFFGTTLWSFIEPKRRSIIESSLNDYSYIKIGIDRKVLSANDTCDFFKSELEFLRSEIKKTEDKKMTCCVLTHHSPLIDSNIVIPKGKSGLKDAYGTDLNFLFGENSVIQAWVYGHTHLSSNFNYKGTKVFSNQYGYKYRCQNTGFKNTSVLSLFNPTEFYQNQRVNNIARIKWIESNL